MISETLRGSYEQDDGLPHYLRMIRITSKLLYTGGVFGR